MLSNVSVRARLLLSFLFMSLLVVVVVCIAISSLRAKGNIYSDYLRDVTSRVDLVSAIHQAATSRALNLAVLVNTADSYERSAAKSRVLAEQDKVADTLDTLQLALEKDSVFKSDKELFLAVTTADSLYRDFVAKTLGSMEADNVEVARSQHTRDAYTTATNLLNAIEAYHAKQTAKAFDVRDAINASIYSGTRNLIMVAVVAVLIALGLAFITSNQIVNPLRYAVTIAKQVAAGDLTARIVVDASDETGQLLKAMQEMVARLRHTVGAVRVGAENIALASNEIANGNYDLSTRTELQAAMLQKTRESTGSISNIASAALTGSNDVHRQTKQAAATAVSAGSLIDAAATSVIGAATKAKDITAMVSLIDELAQQTNLLSLNAAVEAARAGKNGQGFNVVAQEVRRLANRTAEAAKSIREMAQDTGSALATVRIHSDAANTSFQELVLVVRDINTDMGQIQAAAANTLTILTETSAAISAIDRMTQQNAALVEEVAATSSAANTQAQDLVELVQKFRV